MSVTVPVASGKPETAENALVDLDRYGIEIVSAKAYLWGGFRYTNARDAVAAAKRGETK